MRKSLLLASFVVISTSALGMLGNGKRGFPYDGSEDKHQTQKIRILAPKEILIDSSNCEQQGKQSQSSSQYEWDPVEQDIQLESLVCRKKKLDINDNIVEILQRYTYFPDLEEMTIGYVNLANISFNVLEFPNLKVLKFLSLFWISQENLSKLLLNARKLEELYLNNNELNTFPLEICELKNLRILDLHDNKITSLPKKMSQLKNLQELYLSGNKLRILPDELLNTKSSIILTVYNNPLISRPESGKNLKIFNEQEDKVWRNPNKFLDYLNKNEAVFTQNGIKKEFEKRKFNKNNIKVIFGRVFDKVIHVGENIKGEKIYTGEKYEQLETEVIERLEKLVNQTVSIQCPKEILEEVLEEYYWFSSEQKDAVKILTGNQNLSALIGRAGSGKTTTMKAVAKIYELSGANVIGMSMAALASENLEKEADIECATIARWTRGGLAEYQGKRIDVIIVDEASMVGIFDWANILKLADEHQAKIILVGDDNQLKPISSGDCFRAALKILGSDNVGKLSKILRQEDKWQNKASIEFSKLNTIKAMSTYDQHERIHELTSIEQISEKFLEIEEEGSTVVICLDNGLRNKINKQIHDIKRKHGILGREIAKIGGKKFSLNEKIIFTENNWDAEVKNGEVATVIEFENGVLTVKSGDKLKNITIEKTDPENPEIKEVIYDKIDYAYAITVTKSQGKTYKNTIVVAHPMMDCKNIYVAMTRHKKNVDLYYKTSDFKNIKNLINRLSRYGQKDLVQDYFVKNSPYRERVQKYNELSKTISKIVKNINKNKANWKDWEKIQNKRVKIGKEISKDYENHELYMNQSGITLEKLEIDCKLRDKPKMR